MILSLFELTRYQLTRGLCLFSLVFACFRLFMSSSVALGRGGPSFRVLGLYVIRVFEASRLQGVEALEL